MNLHEFLVGTSDNRLNDFEGDMQPAVVNAEFLRRP